MRFEKPHSLSYQAMTFDEVAAHDLRVGRVDDRRVRVAVEVDRHERLVARHARMPLSGPVGRRLEAPR